MADFGWGIRYSHDMGGGGMDNCEGKFSLKNRELTVQTLQTICKLSLQNFA